MTSPLATAPAARLGTVVLEAGELDDLVVKVQDALIGARARRHRVAIVCPGGEASRLREGLPQHLRSVPIMARESWWKSPALDTPLVGFLPAAADYWRPRWDLMPKSDGLVRLWIPTLIPTKPDGAMIYDKATAWVATTGLLRHMFDERSDNFGLAAVVEGLARRGMPVGYASTPGAAPRSGPPAPRTAPPPLRRDAQVLAIVPHHRCEPWLEQCLRSLTRQTRPPEAIVVVDDGSPAPPSDIVARFPTVTLLRARENGGPYRLVQSVIDGTDFDAYMLQDADDWSTDDRLALQLAEAERTGAESARRQRLVPAAS